MEEGWVLLCSVALGITAILLHCATGLLKPLQSLAALSNTHKSEEFEKPQPLLVSKKVRQYTPNLYGSTRSICTAVPSWLLSLEEREPNSTPPICTAVRLPFVRQYASHLYGTTFEKILGVGVTEKFSNKSSPNRQETPSRNRFSVNIWP